MSTAEIPEGVAAVVICGEVAAWCHCVLEPGHEGPHECDPIRCGGAWTGVLDEPDFELVRTPGSGSGAIVDPLVSLMAGLLGLEGGD